MGIVATHRRTATMVLMIKDLAHFEELINGDKPVVVDFTATWCGPCKAIAPFFEELAGKYPDIVFVKVDVDDCDDVAAKCGISAMPTFHKYAKGAKVKEVVGASKDKLVEL